MPATLKAAGNPSKAFFINMITRDITLTDCMLDLLDNSVDGINRLKHGSTNWNGSRYIGFSVKMQLGERSFSISDNCGGIPIKIAQEYLPFRKTGRCHHRYGSIDRFVWDRDEAGNVQNG